MMGDPHRAPYAAYQDIRDAVLDRRTLRAVYQGEKHVLRPRALGHRGPDAYTLVFVIQGDVALTLEPFFSPRRWRWLHVGDLTAIAPVPPGHRCRCPRVAQTDPLPPGLTIDLVV
jgi:hypothetical protein